MAANRTAPQPGERRSTEWAHGVIRGRILSGEIEPGAELAQATLAEELGISRTPLREAMRLLQNEGLLEGEPNRRLRAAGVSADELEQIYAMRIANECLALRVGVPLMDPEDVAAVRASLAAMEAAMLEADLESVEAAHRRFHELPIAKAGERFTQAAATMWDHTARYRSAYLASAENLVELAFEAQADHARIAAAIEAGDGSTASAALADHYARTAEVLIAASGENREPVLLRAAAELARDGAP